jgi:hypothetical protein
MIPIYAIEMKLALMVSSLFKNIRSKKTDYRFPPVGMSASRDIK